MSNSYELNNDAIILASNVPGQSIDIDDAPTYVPTEEQLGLAFYEVVDNQTPQVSDPVQYFVFDPNNFESLVEGEQPLNFDESISTLPNNFKFGQAEYFASGGPRNLGYANISDNSYVRTNNFVLADTNLNLEARFIFNEIWKEGSIELTIKPEKDNCTLLSGVLTSGMNNNSYESPFAIGNQGGFNLASTFTYFKTRTKQYIPYKTEDDRGYINNVMKAFPIEWAEGNGYGVGQEALVENSRDVFVLGDLVTPGSIPDASNGASLIDSISQFRLFKVDIVDGYLKVSYEIFYGPNKQKVEFVGNTNIVDGNWHHIVINRPSPFTEREPGIEAGGNGHIEIWVDGQLDARNFEINSNDPLPVPSYIFNNAINPGIVNYQLKLDADNNFASHEWVDENVSRDGYVGGIRDYIFRQSLALSPHQVNQNYSYAMLNDSQSTIIKVADLSASIEVVGPQVSANKKKVLKLYWNDLINDKEKMLNGLEFDDTYQVYSYSVTHENIVNPTKTFNLDLNDSTKPRVFTKNVRMASGQNVYIHAPNVLASASTLMVPGGSAGMQGDNIMIDVMNDNRILRETTDLPHWFITNMQIGGVLPQAGDRILLFNQTQSNQNGIYTYHGPQVPLTRVEDIDTNILENLHVYVEQGKYAGKTFVQTENVEHLRRSKQIWREIDSESSLSTLDAYPIHVGPWKDAQGNERFIDLNVDINHDYDVIAFMNYPETNSDIFNVFSGRTDIYTKQKYQEFIENIKTAVNNGKSIYVSSPMLAVDLGVVSKYDQIDQLLEGNGDAQSAAISPFESGEPEENYFDTHRNIKYQMCTPTAGLTDHETYIMTDFVTYSPDRINSEYHIKYEYRQNGILEGDEFYISGLTLLPETLNESLPGYRNNQKNIKPLTVFHVSDILMGNCVTRLANTIYEGDTPIQNPYDDFITTIVATYGDGKIFVNCIEDGYALSRADYNKGIVQNVTIGENAETAQTAAWQYSTKRLAKKNVFDYAEKTNLIGQTIPTNGGGGPIVQSQSHCSNGMIRVRTDAEKLEQKSDLYATETEEVFETTEIPVLSMTWLGLKWLAE